MTAALAVVPALPIRAAVYARISLDQTGQSQGVDRQQATCRDIAEREGWDVVEVVTDNDVSAYSGITRPGYERLLTLIERREIDAVIAYHSDRLYRRPRDLERLVDVIERADVRVVTAMSGAVDLSTASGRMVAKMLAVVSEHESARIGERVSAKHRSNAEGGRAHGGGRAFGYGRVEGRPGELVIVPEEAELVREAAERILRGSSLNGIVIDWNQRGIPTVKGNKWRPNSLSKLLRAGRIAGLREVDGDVLGDGAWEAILDRDTWERVRSRITHAPVGRRPKKALLAGMVVCKHTAPCGVVKRDPKTKDRVECEWCKKHAPGDTCGARMRAVTGGNDKYRGRAYQCDEPIAHGCGSNAVKAAKRRDEQGEAIESDPPGVEDIVVEHVLAALAGVNLAQERARRTVASSASLVASIAQDEQMLNDLYADLGARRIERAQLLAAEEPIRKRLVENRRALEQAATDSELDDTVFEGLTRDRWDELNFDQKRAVIRLFVDRIEIAKGRPGRNFDPSRVTIVPT